MKIVSINTVFFGSTGKIMLSINKMAEENGHKTLPISGFVLGKTQVPENGVVIGGYFSKAVHKVLAKISGFQGCFSYFATKKAIRKIDRFNPDIIHLHNLHAWFINLPLLFNYIKKSNVKVVWTFHDCWPITGQCTHFTLANCNKWQTGCENCPQYKQYPESFVDQTKKLYKLKKKWFKDVSNLTVVTPSKWLAELVKSSFLGEYPVKIINNGIDLQVFKPIVSSFREKYNIPTDKKIILGVSFGWSYKKGLDVFCELAQRLDSEKFQIVLVGTDADTDKQLPKSILSIHRTSDQKELAEIYSAADVFVNATREDNFPTVNIEALACGTPVITFETGGSNEIIDEACGRTVECDDLDSLLNEIIDVTQANFISGEACVNRAKQFDSDIKFKEYINLYEMIENQNRK